jgi:choline dehydrogenase-like flavoprotein
MLLDLRDDAAPTRIRCDVCVVGAGAAGITLARELACAGIETVLLEAGGRRLEADTQALYRGESEGLPYGGLDETRFRYLGGSTNPEGWGGWCKPLEAIDFEQRAWAPYSGWPVTRAELDPWYRRAQAICEAGPYDYDLERWRERIDRPLGDLPLRGGTIETQLAQLSPPTRFGKRYADELDAAPTVQLVLHANATEILTDADGTTATGVRARTLDGRELHVEASAVVLASGGIENARLLLASRGGAEGGLGNEHDLVGRFFSDHPALWLGSIEFREQPTSFYDCYARFRGRDRSQRGTYHPSLIAGGLAITDATQRSEQLLNYRGWIVAEYWGDGTPAADALKRLYLGLRDRELPASARTDAKAILRRPDHAASTAVGRFFEPRALARGYRLLNVLEPEQVPESRIRLSERSDRIGMPVVVLDWRVGTAVRRTLATAHALIDDELRATGVGKLVDPFREDQEARFVEALEWVWHHMGTTRMHADPDQGVVDGDCRVHSTTNVFVAGSSVFPTQGGDMPTLTIVALALRLADNLQQRLGAGAAGSPTALDASTLAVGG